MLNLQHLVLRKWRYCPPDLLKNAVQSLSLHFTFKKIIFIKSCGGNFRGIIFYFVWQTLLKNSPLTPATCTCKLHASYSATEKMAVLVLNTANKIANTAIFSVALYLLACMFHGSHGSLHSTLKIFLTCGSDSTQPLRKRTIPKYMWHILEIYCTYMSAICIHYIGIC